MHFACSALHCLFKSANISNISFPFSFPLSGYLYLSASISLSPPVCIAVGPVWGCQLSSINDARALSVSANFHISPMLGPLFPTPPLYSPLSPLHDCLQYIQLVFCLFVSAASSILIIIIIIMIPVMHISCSSALLENGSIIFNMGGGFLQTSMEIQSKIIQITTFSK